MRAYGAFPRVATPDELRGIDGASIMPVFDAYAAKGVEKSKEEQECRCRLVAHGGREVMMCDGSFVGDCYRDEIQAAGASEVRLGLAVGSVNDQEVMSGDVEAAYLNTEPTGKPFGRLPKWLFGMLFPEEAAAGPLPGLPTSGRSARPTVTCVSS